MNDVVFTRLIISHGVLWNNTRPNTKCVSAWWTHPHTGCNKKRHDDCKLMKDDDLSTDYRPKRTGKYGNSGATAYTITVNIR